ncbi:MAG: hypothetical protein Q7T13_20540 [Polaromonas sp.]|nr:hypothetical protein [Polaromonas sp.]
MLEKQWEEYLMSDRRLFWLLYAVLLVGALNLAVTLYFHSGKKPSEASLPGGASDVTHQVTDKEATELAQSVVDLYNDNKIHELYLKFDDLAKLQFSEQKLSDELTKLRAVVGRVDQFAYANTELAGKDAGRTYLTLHFKARVSGAAFTSGTVKLTVSRKDGRLALYGFFLGGQSS